MKQKPEKSRPYILEACVETKKEALKAENLGADQLELCSRLDLDGLSPSPELISQTLDACSIPVKAMVRPRGGNFIYTKQELEEMMKEIDFLRQFPLKELVLGVSKPNGRLNIEDIRLLCEKAYPQKITIHKAIDLSPQPLEDLKDLLDIENITSVLSSGCSPTAMGGHEVLNKLSKLSEGKIAIIAAGKITNNNIKQVASLIHTTAFHGRKIVGQL